MFAKDIRPEITGYDINFWYLTGTTDEVVTLSWICENLPDDLNVNLYISEEVIDMTVISNIDISVADFSSFEIRTGFESTNSEDNLIPIKTSLYGNYPNPFNPETTIEYSLKESGNICLEIYNIRGQKVNTLFNEFRKAGYHSVIWSGKDINDNPVSSGIYFYKLNVNDKTESIKKCLLLK